MAALLEVAQEAVHPGAVARSVGPGRPGVDVGLEAGAAEVECRVDAVQGVGPLNVQRAVVFRRHVLAVGFFAHLDAAQG